MTKKSAEEILKETEERLGIFSLDPYEVCEKMRKVALEAMDIYSRQSLPEPTLEYLNELYEDTPEQILQQSEYYLRGFKCGLDYRSLPELPSDEEIENAAEKKYPTSNRMLTDQESNYYIIKEQDAYVEGAKFLREKIKQGKR